MQEAVIRKLTGILLAYFYLMYGGFLRTNREYEYLENVYNVDFSKVTYFIYGRYIIIQKRKKKKKKRKRNYGIIFDYLAIVIIKCDFPPAVRINSRI